MNPYLDQHHNPRLQIQVKLSTWETLDCLIDTGFSGGIALPQKAQKKLDSKPIAFQEYELADGSHKIFTLYKIESRFNHRQKLITGFFTESNEGLVGIEFLTGFYLELNLKRFTISLE